MLPGPDAGADPAADRPTAAAPHRAFDPPGRDAVAAELAEREAAAFVHVARDDPAMRYCTATPLSDAHAYVQTADERVLCVPDHAVDEAGGFEGRVRSTGGRAPALEAVAVLDEAGGGETVLAPRDVPHDAALYVEGGGYDLASTDAVERARATKTDAEVDRVAAAQAAADAGVERAAAVLAAAGAADGGGLRHEGAALTVERLRRVAGAAVAAAGATPETVVVGAGERRSPADAPLAAGETVVVTVVARGPLGYHGVRTRTYVVDGEGGWERRAHVAVTGALRAAVNAVEPDADLAAVRREVVGEVGAYGFEHDGSAGHGLGLERREAPPLDGGGSLDPGAVLRLTPRVVREEGVVALDAVAVVTADGHAVLGSVPESMTPRAAPE